MIRHGCAFKFARSPRHVWELLGRQAERGGGGKFITVYPDQDEGRLRTLAGELHQATLGLPGPGILSDRPYRPGSLVYYRFGAFGGVPMLSNDGSYESMLVAPDGALVADQRLAWFAPPPWIRRDPFTGQRFDAPGPAKKPKPVLLNGRYVVREVIRHSFTGGVYRAVDQDTGAPVIVKQARKWAGAMLTGEDVRDLRRHETELLRQFAPSGLTPRLLDQFEQQGDLFQVQEMIDGATLPEWVTRNLTPDDGGAWGIAVDRAVRIAEALVDLVAAVHDHGLVLRDLKPDNVMVAADDTLRLIDLELLARPGEVTARALTVAYAAPEYRAAPAVGPAPGTEADLFSLGVSLCVLASGGPPVLPDDVPPRQRTYRERLETWLASLAGRNATARRLAPVVLALVDEDPSRRADLATVRALLSEPAGGPDAAYAETAFADSGLKRAVEDGLAQLVATMEPDNPRRLWPIGEFGERTDPFTVQHGAAGVLGVLVRACQADPDDPLRSAAATAAGWIRRHVAREPRSLPGLYFGRAGTAWALLDAGRLLGDDELVDLATDLAMRVPVRWPNPDVCHGAAGAGLTQLRFWEATADQAFLDRARHAADALVAAAERRDDVLCWPIPREFASALAGLVHYGYAHGTAGVGAFLLAMARITGASQYRDLAVAAADALLKVADVDQGAAYWRRGPGPGPRMTYWCSGSSGIGTFLVRAWRDTGDERYGDMAAQAAVAVRRSRWQAGPSQCHGLAGDAEFLLDLADAGAGARYRDWADDLATSIYARHVLVDGRMLAPDEMITTVNADYNTGLAGVLAFLLRMRDGGPRMWLPETLTALGPPPSHHSHPTEGR